MTDFSKFQPIKFPIKFESQSLIGVRKDKMPTTWGNYFTLRFNKYEIRVVNMWKENLSYAITKQIIDDSLIEAVIYPELNTETPGFALVVDSRLPPTYLYNNLCFTGSALPSIEAIKDMFRRVGDQNNELEQYVDPQSYWGKHGREFITSNGFCYTRTRRS